MVQLGSDIGTKMGMPHGAYGGILHMFTLGLFGNQSERTEKPISSDYKTKPKPEDNISAKTDRTKSISMALGDESETHRLKKDGGYEIVKVKTPKEEEDTK